jgi:hypothetical protein
MYFHFLNNFCLKDFTFYEKLSEILSKLSGGLRVKYALLFSDFNQNWIPLTDFRKINIKFHENPTSGSRVVLCGRTDRQYEANSHFLNFANEPTNWSNSMHIKWFKRFRIQSTNTATRFGGSHHHLNQVSPPVRIKTQLAAYSCAICILNKCTRNKIMLCLRVHVCQYVIRAVGCTCLSSVLSRWIHTFRFVSLLVMD